MSSLCCCRGLLSMFGVKGYPMDVVAKAKLDRAKMSRSKQNDYSTMSNENSTENKNGSVVRSEPQGLSDASETPSYNSNRKHERKPRRKHNSRSSRKSDRRSRRHARSFDDSDSDSSVDSAEETMKTIRKSIRKSQSIRGSRDTLNSIRSDSKSTVGSEKMRDLEVEDETHRSPASPRLGSPVIVLTTPPREDDLNYERKEEYSPEYTTEREAEERRKTISGPTSRVIHEADTFDFPENEASTSQYQGRATMGSLREFSRKQAIRKSPRTSPSLSSRSNKSLATSYTSSKWGLGDEESLYREEHIASALRESRGEDELAMAREASRDAVRPIGELDDEDEEMEAHAAEPISACGTLDVGVQYSVSDSKLQVTIIEAHDLPSKARGGSSFVQVRTVLLPTKKKKYKTKVQHISSPRFAETFKLTRASPEDLRGLALRLRMYGIGKLKDRLIGEAVIRFDELNLIRDPQLTVQLQLEPRTNINRVDSDTSLSNIDSRSSSMMSLSHGGSPPELLVGLSYNPPTGRLCVEVIKGSHFRNLAMTKPPDTFVKLSLLNSACQEMSQSKTTIRRGQPNPVFKETFFFQVALFQLGEVTLMVSVYNKRTIKKKEMIGWVSMGRNSSSEPDEQHWQEMKEGKGQQVCRWHTLIDT
uniref:synaptotagmin-10-like isoform X2 n=1 Tax=Styela clava TaxID=7725 RepID=UPI00193A196D|nr:synaptotagmin-10-like isoform X2 [Styela clava]